MIEQGGADIFGGAKESKQDSIIEKLFFASYQLSDFDADSNPVYIGKVDKDGAWFIKQIDTSAGTALYAKGDTGYDFSSRASLTYDTFSNLF